MGLKPADIEKLKTTFLAKVGGVMNGPIKPDQTDTHDLGTSTQRWNKIYAKEIIADNLTGQGGGGGGDTDNADTVDHFHALADPQANTLLPLNSLGVYPKETYHLALLTSGERSLMGNLDVGGGFRIDGVDISEHVHNGMPGMGTKIDHRDLLANDSDVHPQYAKKATDEIITGNWMFTDVENRSVGWLFEPLTKVFRALPHNIKFSASVDDAEIVMGANDEIVSHVDANDTWMRIGLSNDSINMSGTDDTYRLWIGSLLPDTAPFTVDKTGSMTAKKGYIGGWAILDDRLEGHYTTLYAGGELWLGDGSENLGRKDRVVLSAIDPDGWRLWAGNDDPDLAPFRVNKWGQSFFSDAFVTGSLRSTNYVSNSSGFQISYDGRAEFYDIRARGRIETVVFSERKASVMSGTFYIADGASLKQPVAAEDAFIIVDSDIFSRDDIIYIKSVDAIELPGGGYSITSFDEHMKIVAPAQSLAADQYKYKVVRDLEGRGQTFNYRIGECFVRMGNAAQARDMVSLASGDDDGAYGAYQPGGSGSSIEGGWLVLEGARGYGPYFGVARRRGPLYNQFDEVVRIGNLQGIAPLMVGRTDSNPFYGAFVGDAAAYWAYDPDGGLRIKTRSGATAIDETGITSDQFSIATADDIPTYTEDRAHIYLTKPSDGAPRLSVKMEVNGVQSFIDRIGNMTLSDFDADADGIIDLAENANSAPWAGITGKPATYAPSAHQHQASDILSLPEFDSSQISARQWMGI